MPFELEIIKHVPPGDGFGYFQDKAVFVPATSPGDRVLVEPIKEKKRFIIGALKEVISPSKERIDAICPHHATCGGCSLMHLPMDQQLLLKKEMLREVLRTNQINSAPAIFPSPVTTQFRYRTQVLCQKGKVGFSARNSNHIIEINQCPILAEVIESNIAHLRNMGRINCHFELLASSIDDSLAVSVKQKGKSEPLPGFAKEVIEDYGYGPIKLASSGFAQSNPSVTRLIINHLIDQIDVGEEICELYCGSGTLSIPIAQKADALWGYDFDLPAITLAEENSARNRLTNTTFKRLNLEKSDAVNKQRCFVVDPPRKGLSHKILNLIGRSKADKLLYVSCNPATFARDANSLVNTHGFNLTLLNAYDMYGYSTHLELLAVFQR